MSRGSSSYTLWVGALALDWELFSSIKSGKIICVDKYVLFMHILSERSTQIRS